MSFLRLIQEEFLTDRYVVMLVTHLQLMMRALVLQAFQHSAAYPPYPATCSRTEVGTPAVVGGVAISSEGVEKSKHSVPAQAGCFPIRSWLFASEFLLSWGTATFQ